MTSITQTSPNRIVLVTGPSGAGRSTATRALEDMGFESIDNMPLSLLPRLLDGRPLHRPVALGIDTRTRGFSVPALLEALDEIAAAGAYDATLLYLDARAEVLLRRFSETRRRHPVSGDDAPAVGVERELALLAPLRERADILIDTSALSPHDLRAALARWFGGGSGAGLAVSLQSFSFKRGLPQELDCVFDVRFLANPHWDETLRPLDGRDARVRAFVEADPRFAAYFARVAGLLTETLPAYRDEGKAHLTVGFGCTGGRHRSVATAEKMANALAEAGWRVSIRHRELERSGT